MLNDKDKAALDQATAVVADTMPPFWRRMYDHCIREGFTQG